MRHMHCQQHQNVRQSRVFSELSLSEAKTRPCFNSSTNYWKGHSSSHVAGHPTSTLGASIRLPNNKMTTLGSTAGGQSHLRPEPCSKASHKSQTASLERDATLRVFSLQVHGICISFPTSFLKVFITMPIKPKREFLEDEQRTKVSMQHKHTHSKQTIVNKQTNI